MEEGEFDEKGEANDIGVHFFKHPRDSGSRPACSKNIVDDKDALFWGEVFGVDLKGVFAIFKFVTFAEGFS